MRTDNSAIAEHTYDADHLLNWSGVQYIAHDRHCSTRREKEAIQIQLNPNTLNRDRGIDIPESWMSTIRRHTQQTKTPTVSARPTIEQPADRPPVTEQHQRDQPGTQHRTNSCTAIFANNHKGCLQIAINKMINHRSIISKATSKVISKAYKNSTHKWPITL